MSVWKSFARETLDVGRALADFRGWRGWVTMGVAVASVVAYVEKRPLQAVLGGGAPKPLEPAALFVQRWCDGHVVGVLSGMLLVVGTLRRVPRAIDTAVTLASGGVWCLALTKVGQLVFAESRPRDGGAMHFFVLGGHGVSGHASGAAMLFWPLLGATRGAPRAWRVASAVLLIAWAVFVGATRVWLDAHFLWDVILGAFIGEEAGRLAVKCHDRRRSAC